MIFYFTATGNSLYAAQKLGSALNEKIINITDAFKNETFSYSLSEDEKVGFVFPTYFYGVPTIIEDFINKLILNFDTKPYIYVLFTCGSSIGVADRMFKKILVKKHLNLSSSFLVRMPDNYILLFKIPPLEQQIAKITKTDDHIKIIANDINNNVYRLVSKPLSVFITLAAYPFYKYGRKTKKFYADNNCISCGKCQNICPVKAIEIVNSKPVWTANQCVHCLACINRCPTNAIQYGKKTKNRNRYQNPILK